MDTPEFPAWKTQAATPHRQVFGPPLIKSGAIPVPFPVDPTPEETATHYWLCLASGETTDQYLARLRCLELTTQTSYQRPEPCSPSIGQIQQRAIFPPTRPKGGAQLDAETIRTIFTQTLARLEAEALTIDRTESSSRDD